MAFDYPKDLHENLKFRARLYEKCKENDETAILTKMMFEQDILFAFNVFFWAYDPFVESRKNLSYKDKDRPLITYAYQDEAILELNHCIETGENVFVDKSRDMLATCIFSCRSTYVGSASGKR